MRSLEEAELVNKTLARYDLFQFDNRIKGDYCNTGGLLVYEDGDWFDWHDDETGDDFDQFLRDKALAKESASPKP